jgi:regulator of replication initiation timing
VQVITKKKKLQILNEIIVHLMQENDQLTKANKKLENLLDLTLIKSGSPHEEQSY